MPLGTTTIPPSETVKSRRSRSQVEPDLHFFGDDDVLVDDGPLDLGVAPHLDIVHENTVRDLAIRIDPHAPADQRPFHPAAGNDGPTADDAVLDDAGQRTVLGETVDGLARRYRRLPGPEEPVAVVEIESRAAADQIHVGFVEAVDGPDVPPVLRFQRPGIPERESIDLLLLHQARNDVMAEVVPRTGNLHVMAELTDQILGVEDVDAHVDQAVVGIAGNRLGVGGLFLEADHAPVVVDLEDAELVGALLRHHRGTQSQAACVLPVAGQQVAVVHLVDVVARKDQDMTRAPVLQQVDVLVNGVGGAFVPLLAHAMLRRNAVKEFPRFVAEDVPTPLQVLVKGVGLVLGQDEDLPQAAIDAVRKGEVDDPVGAAKGDGRLGTVAGQGIEPVALSAGENEGERVAHHLTGTQWSNSTGSWFGARRRTRRRDISSWPPAWLPPVP